MQFTIKAIGIKSLLLHNVDLANPRNEWARKMTDLRGVPSRRRTDDWLDEMEYVSFMGAFYDIPEIDGIGVPAENMRQCLIAAAKMTRLGTQAKRAIIVTTPAVPLIFTDGEWLRKPQELWDSGRYKITRMIRGTGGASPTTYPIFDEWALRVPFELEESALNLRDLKQIAERAGHMEGLGASRKQGYGRFDALIET